MRCKKCRSLLLDYIDQTLPQAMAQDVDSHLSSCPDCRSRVEQERLLGRIVRRAWGQETSELRFRPQPLGEQPSRPQVAGIARRRLPSFAFPAFRSVSLLAIVLLVAGVLFLVSRGILRKKTPLPLENASALIEVSHELADPLKDWAARRLHIFILDEEGRPIETFITSPSDKNIVHFKNERKER